MIAHIMAAARRRAAIPEDERRLALLIIDEAKTYFDEKTEEVLADARQFGLGLVFATQHLEQLPDGVRKAMYGNTAVKLVGKVGYAPRLHHDLILEPRDLQILKLFRTYRLLPTNIIVDLVGGNYGVIQRRLKMLAAGVYSLKTGKLVMSGLLDRFNFNGSTNVNAVMVYSLSDRGDQRLTEIGFPAFDLYDRSHNSHQALLDLLDVGVELGVHGTDLRLVRWPEIVAHPRTPKMPPNLTVS